MNDSQTNANDPRYWRGKLMTAKRMENDGDAAWYRVQLELCKAVIALDEAWTKIHEVDPQSDALGYVRTAINELEVNRDSR